MKVLMLILCSLYGGAATRAAVVEKEVFFYNGKLKLSGVLFAAKGSSGKAVVIIHGSGNSDRSNLWAYSIAKGLADRGITVLLPDKRGCGKSQGDWKSSSFETLAMDAIAGVDFLLDSAELELSAAGILGLSQGGLIAPLAATLSKKVNFVIDAVGSATTLEETMIFEMINTCKQSKLEPKSIGDVLDLHTRMKDFVLSGDWNSYEQKLNEMKSGPQAAFASNFPPTKSAWIWSWVKLNYNYDPLQYWRKVTVPKLIVYGERDENDNVPVYRSTYLLHEAFQNSSNLNYTIRIYPNTGHALYKEDISEIRPDFLDETCAWILQFD